MKTELKEDFLKLTEKGATVTSICKKLDIHRSTFYDWRDNDPEFLQKFIRARVMAKEETDDAASHHYHRLVREGDPKFVRKWLDQQHPDFARKAIQLIFRKENEIENAISSMNKEELFMLIRAYKHAGFQALDTLDEKTKEEFREWYNKHNPHDQQSSKTTTRDIVIGNIMKKSLGLSTKNSPQNSSEPEHLPLDES